MTAAVATRRGVIGMLLLHGIEYTNARPWIGFVGAAVTGLVGAAVKAVFL